MEGFLAAHPLAELIAEMTSAQLSGALRLTRERVKAAVYFDSGELIYASSNLRAHRLAHLVKRHAETAGSQVQQFPDNSTDDDVAALVLRRGILTQTELDLIRSNQVTEVLRVILLWTDGTWNFDVRARLAEKVRVAIDVSRLLLESTRHLPADFISSRFSEAAGTFAITENSVNGNLLPEEAFILSRADTPVSLSELRALSGIDNERSLRAIYGLSLAGCLNHSQPMRALSRQKTFVKPKAVAEKVVAKAISSEQKDLEEFFVRLDQAKDHYEALNLDHIATAEEIKTAYHALARSYHPDRFHQRDAKLRSRLEGAFARISQAYETLSDQVSRATYDKRIAKPANDQNQSESSFQKGKAALQQGRRAEGLRFLSEAAIQQPRNAKYRAEYGKALTGEPNSRRLAESELQAAIALDPNTCSYRVLLADFYYQNGLRRRATGELERALAIDPANESARNLMSKIKTK